MASKNGKRTITAEDLYEFQLISQPRLSPNGQYVVYTQQRIDRKTEKKYTNLWITLTEPKAVPRQFTYGDQNDNHPRWSPDSSQIAFLSNRADKEKQAQIYLIPMAGGEARKLTEIDGLIDDFTWAPDGKTLLCTIRKLDPEALERQKDEQKKKLGVVARHYNRLFYKLDGFGYLPLERTHLWLVDTTTGKAKQLTDHPVHDEYDASWSPDGKEIIYVSNLEDSPDDYPDRQEILVISRRGGEARKIPTHLGSKGSPVYSPDGKWIAFFSQEGEGQGYKNWGLWVMPADESKPPVNLTAPFDLHTSASTINDMGSPEQMPATWSPDSSRIYFQVVLHGSTLLMSIKVDGNGLTPVIGEGGVAGAFTFDASGSCLAYFYGTLADPGQIFLRDLLTGQDRQLTQANQNLLARLDLGTIEEVWFKGPAGNDLQGWILRPPGFDPAKKYPSIMEIHGGPLTQYGNFFMHEFYYLAANGFVVYFSNPRGGRGYGQEHSKAIHNSWGGADYDDLMAWADYMEKQPYIDRDRMGVTGGSYGGYMTVWIIGHTQRFKSAVTQRCVSNFVSMWGSSDFNWAFQQELGDKPPFEDLENYWKASPISYIGNAKTPTLVIHNENDLRCPIEQGEQVFVALKRLGVETEFVRFPDEFHGLSRTGRTDRRIARLNHILRWMQKYLQNQ